MSIPHQEVLIIHSPTETNPYTKFWAIAVVDGTEETINYLAPGCNPSRHLIILSSKPIQPGMSGSPLLDDDSNVVGMLIKVSRVNNKVGLVRKITFEDIAT